MKEESVQKLADAIFQGLGEISHSIDTLANAMDNVSESLHKLGTNHATSDVGAIELLSKELKEGLERVSDTIEKSNMGD